MAREYIINEVFDSIQGEGMRAGVRSVFVRFAGCNLWDGTPEGREKGKAACARWCDTDFRGGERLGLDALLARMDALWPLPERGLRNCVLTGGEPFLQVDADLIRALRVANWFTAIETNGTLDPDLDGIHLARAVDWVTISPKKGAPLVLRWAHELKVVLPGWTDDELLQLAREGSYYHLRVQPLTIGSLLSPETRAHTERCIEFVMAHPEWAFGLQLHKLVGVR